MTDIDDLAPAEANRSSLSRRAARSTIEWIVIIAAALLVAFVVKTFLIQAFYIPSASMDPTLRIKDRVLVNKMSYRLHDINRGDIVVFERPECDQSDPKIKDLIKRVVALEGETVQGENGRVLIDGRPLNEPYLQVSPATDDFGPYEVPDGHIWVMGDNRSNSSDSRRLCGKLTSIPEDDVVGRAFVRIWPFGKLTLL